MEKEREHRGSLQDTSEAEGQIRVWIEQQGQRGLFVTLSLERHKNNVI